MSIENTADWKGLGRRIAKRIVRLTLDRLAAKYRPGVTTGELDEIAARLFAKHGARRRRHWSTGSRAPC